jgi:hypothetical protein
MGRGSVVNLWMVTVLVVPVLLVVAVIFRVRRGVAA